MAGTATPSYGTPNWEMLKGWFALAPENDGPFWALNLMKYRAVAEYADTETTSVSGKEADDAYAPLGPLAAIGALVAFHGDVIQQLSGSPSWDRIGIVRYPSRAAFFAMQQRDDFKDQHVHKEAGMEFTIVMSCLPEATETPGTDTSDRLVLSVERGTATGPLPDGITLVADFTVEGVIVGDDRSFDRARFVRAADADAVAAFAAHARAAEEAHIVVVERAIDRLVASIVDAPA